MVTLFAGRRNAVVTTGTFHQHRLRYRQMLDRHRLPGGGVMARIAGIVGAYMFLTDAARTAAIMTFHALDVGLVVAKGRGTPCTAY